jgi:hypothetical protein
MKTKYIVRVIFPLLLVMLAPALRAGSLNPAVIGLFPKNVGEFAYADLRQARQFPWFAQFQEQVLPARFREFEHFLTTAGINPDTQVQELAWAVLTPAASASANGAVADKGMPSADQIVGVALGQYSPDSAEAFFKAHKLATAQVHDYTLYAFGSGTGATDLFFVFIDSNTAAFGQKAMLEHMLDARDGVEESLNANETMSPLINQANGQGVFWGVLNPAYTRFALQQLMPETSQFPAAGQLMGRVVALMISVQGTGSQIQTDFNAVCASAEDASTMAQLLQAAVLLRRYQAAQTNPQLAQLLDAARIVPNGTKLNVSFTMSNDQIASLIRSNTFAMKQ